MSQSGLTAEPRVAWPSNGISEVPFRLYTDPAQYQREQERLFKGPTWNYLCLAVELAKPGDYVATTIGETAVIVVRDAAGAINAFVNRCAHRGNLLCLERAGNAKEFACIYHGWTYDLAGQLTGVAFEHGVKRQGGMPPEFRKDEHRLQRLRIAELGGLVFGTFSDAAPDLETYLGPDVTRGLLRVMNRTPHAARPQHAGDAEQLEALFREREGHLPRLDPAPVPDDVPDQPAQHAGRHLHQPRRRQPLQLRQARLRRRGRRLQGGEAARRQRVPACRTARSSNSVDEYGDGVSVQILTVFPGMVLQQVRNTIAVRVIRPRGVDKAELEWIHLGFDTDDEAMTERRLRQGNLIGAAGYISMEDGCVGGFVQRALQYNDEGAGLVMMGGHEAESQTFRASEAAIRGFWKHYRTLMGE